MSATTKSVARSGDQRIDGELAGMKWAGGTVTYSIPDSKSDYEYAAPGFSSLRADQIRAVQATLDADRLTQDPGHAGFSVEGFTNLDVDFLGLGSGAGTLRYANSTEAGTAYAYFPANSASGGDSWYGQAGDHPTVGNYDYFTVIHETGHALGLKHGHETGTYGALPHATDSSEYSAMTYRSYVGADGAYVYNGPWDYPQTFMMYDIAALQYMYGADFSTMAGDTVYAWNPGSGTTTVDGRVALQPGGNRIFLTIWDGGGIDTYDLSRYDTDLDISLAPGEHSTFATKQLARLDGNGHPASGNVYNALQYKGDARSLIENAIGGSGDDTISGNAAGNGLRGGDGDDVLSGLGGADTLSGGRGADVLRGGGSADDLAGDAGADKLTGGGGWDVFHFAAGDSTPGARDTLVHGDSAAAFQNPGNKVGDIIDVSAIDAIATSTGDQAFVFGGTGKGHLWATNSGKFTLVRANVDNDAAPEFELAIDDGATVASAYTQADFWL